MKIDKNATKIILLSILGAVATWILNHQIGLGPIIANGIIGVAAGLFLPKALAGTTYTASFVGMSGINVIPSILGVVLGGIVVGIILANTQEIYAGLGGKGGTTAALSTLITKSILNLFG